MGVRKILIVGGGIAGMVLATAARRKGLDVDLVEIEPRVVGVGIFLTGSTLRALDSIGLAQACVCEGWPAESLRLLDGHGEFIASNPMPRIADPRLPISAGIPRPTLARILHDAAKEAGAEIRIGLTVDSLAQDDEGVLVAFSDGGRGRYDAVVGADGIYSRVRGLLFGEDSRPIHTGQGGWRFMTPRHPEVDGMMIFAMDGLKCGFIPLNKDWMYVLSTMTDPNRVWIDPTRTTEIYRRFLEPFEAPLVQEMRVRMETADPASVMWRPFEVLLLEDRWSKGRAIVIGDAAHSMTPHLTSGGGMAIEDAIVLSNYLAGDAPVAEALEAFYKQRIDRVRKVQGISLAICAEEISSMPSRERIYELTVEGYGALAVPFMVETRGEAGSAVA